MSVIAAPTGIVVAGTVVGAAYLFISIIAFSITAFLTTITIRVFRTLITFFLTRGETLITRGPSIFRTTSRFSGSITDISFYAITIKIAAFIILGLYFVFAEIATTLGVLRIITLAATTFLTSFWITLIIRYTFVTLFSGCWVTTIIFRVRSVCQGIDRTTTKDSAAATAFIYIVSIKIAGLTKTTRVICAIFVFVITKHTFFADVIATTPFELRIRPLNTEIGIIIPAGLICTIINTPF